MSKGINYEYTKLTLWDSLKISFRLYVLGILKPSEIMNIDGYRLTKLPLKIYSDKQRSRALKLRNIIYKDCYINYHPKTEVGATAYKEIYSFTSLILLLEYRSIKKE